MIATKVLSRRHLCLRKRGRRGWGQGIFPTTDNHCCQRRSVHLRWGLASIGLPLSTSSLQGQIVFASGERLGSVGDRLGPVFCSIAALLYHGRVQTSRAV